MFTYYISQIFTFSILITILFLVNDHCVGANSGSINSSFVGGFSNAVATWYGSPMGAGSGGACGFQNDVASRIYNGLISAGNNNIFKSGQGCGTCYQVKCTQNPSCSGYPITVTITDECPGACNNEPFHFDLSGKAFGYLAKRGQADILRKAGRINIQYQRVPCYYVGTSIVFKIDTDSNRFFLAFVIEYENGDGDLGRVELSPSNSRGWISMQHDYGATWKTQLDNKIRGPYSVRITTIESRRTIVATNVIPANWVPGQYYRSTVNF